MPAAPRLGLVGFGQFGRGLAELAAEAGVGVRAVDPAVEVPEDLRAPDLASLAADADVLVVAVPVASTRSAVESLRPHLTPRHLVLDVGSVKLGPVADMEAALGRAVPWVGTHPLFGPASLALGERPLRVVVCPNAMHPGAAPRTRTLWERLGCVVLEQTADEHDRVMAETHALALFIAKGLLATTGGAAPAFAPPSFQAVSRVIDTVRADAGHLFLAIQRANPHAATARRRLLEALARIDAEAVAAAVPAGASPHGAPGLAIPDLGARNPALRETRELIDELDAELVRLLARRMQLARRAGRLKADAGHPVRDARREDELRARHRALAEGERLAPDVVADVFEAVLRHSRKAQG
jgi:prephenate dehydrogenase